MNHLSKVDFLGSAQSLKINGKIIYKNIFGGIISILVVISTIFSAVYFGKEIWERNSPIVNSSYEVDSSPFELRLDKEKWDLFFGLQYKNKLFIDDSIYKVKSRVYSYTSSKGFKIEEFKTEECTEGSFSQNTFSLFNQYNFKSGRCISQNQTVDIMLNKLWGQEDFKYIEISLYPCINTTYIDNNSIKCKPKEIIDEYLMTGVFSIYTIYNNIQTKDYKSPFKMAIYNDFYPVSQKTFTHSIIFLMHSTIKSDIGWLMQELKEDRGFNINRIKQNFYTSNEEDSRFMRFQFQLANTIGIYTRKYMKLQELCAQIGGITKFLIIIGSVICYIDKNISYKEYLVNMFFDDDLKDNLNIKKNRSSTNNKGKSFKNQIKPGKISNINNFIQQNKNNSSINFIKNTYNKSNIQMNTQIINSSIRKTTYLDYIFFPIRSKLYINFLEKHVFFIFFCCCKSKKFSKLNKSFAILNETLTVEQHIHNTRDIRKIRFFLFSDYENDIFDRIGNPIVVTDKIVGQENKEKRRNVKTIQKKKLNQYENGFSELYSFVNKGYYDYIKDSIKYDNSYIEEVRNLNSTNREYYINKIMNVYETRPNI